MSYSIFLRRDVSVLCAAFEPHVDGKMRMNYRIFQRVSWPEWPSPNRESKNYMRFDIADEESAGLLFSQHVGIEFWQPFLSLIQSVKRYS
jgi:hypothetical protein